MEKGRCRSGGGNLRRISVATDLLSRGMAPEAYRLLDLVLSERVAADLRREAKLSPLRINDTSGGRVDFRS